MDDSQMDDGDVSFYISLFMQMAQKRFYGRPR